MAKDHRTSYSRLIDSEPLSVVSSRTSSPAPLPPDEHFAYSTSLRRQEPEHTSIIDFTHGHATTSHQQSNRFTAYDVPSSSSTSSHQVTHGSAGPGGYAHHPFAHTTTPLTPSSHYATLSIPQTLSALSTSATTGLASGKVPAIRELSGPNEFEVAAKDPLWKRFAGQFREPLIMLLLGSAAVSAFVGNYDDAASIVAAILIVVTGECAHTTLTASATWDGPD